MQEYEGSFLSCLLINPALIFKTKLTEQYFTSGENRKLFRAMLGCSERKLEIDYVALCEVEPSLDKTYAPRIYSMAPSSSNWSFYEKKIIEAYQRARLITIGQTLRDIPDSKDPTECIEEIGNELMKLSSGCNSTKITKLSELIPENLKIYEERFKNKNKLPGISTGLNDLDSKIGGLQNSRYYVIGSRPSDGKSALAVNIACHIGIREQCAVGILSAESSNNEIVTRVFSSEGRIDGQRISIGNLHGADFQSLMDTGVKMDGAPIYLYDTPNIQFREMKSVIRQMVTAYKIKVVIVDYLQIIQWADKSLAKHEQVAAVSLAIKELARELKIPIVALSQLRRDSEGREPEMADLDYSKQIEQDADAIVLIFHPKAKEGTEPKPSMLLIKKNRDGPKGAVFVKFAREYVRFYEIQEERE